METPEKCRVYDILSPEKCKIAINLTKVHADAIVNTANPKPIYANGTDRAIYEAARSELVLEERAVTYECDAKGTALNYEAIGEAITTVRCNARLDRSWKEKIEEDHRKRGKKNRIIYDQPE